MELKGLEQVRSTQTRLLEKEIEEKEKKLEQAEEEYNALRKDLWFTEAKLKLKKDEVEAQRKELKKVQEKSMELQQNLTYSETELRLIKGQLEKVKEESQRNKEVSDSLFRQLISAEAELKFTQEQVEEKAKELEKVKEEAKTLREKLLNAEAKLNVKNKELQWQDKEMKEVKDQLSSTVANLSRFLPPNLFQFQVSSTKAELQSKNKDLESKKKVEELQKKLEILYPGLSDPCLEIVMSQRHKVSSRNVIIDKGNSNWPAFVLPARGQSPSVFTPVNIDTHKSTAIDFGKIYISDGQWDKENWWAVTVNGDEDWSYKRPCIIAFYGGSFDTAEAYGIPVNIPFHRDATLKYQFTWLIGVIKGIGLRFLLGFKSD